MTWYQTSGILLPQILFAEFILSCWHSSQAVTGQSKSPLRAHLTMGIIHCLIPLNSGGAGFSQGDAEQEPPGQLSPLWMPTEAQHVILDVGVLRFLDSGVSGKYPLSYSRQCNQLLEWILGRELLPPFSSDTPFLLTQQHLLISTPSQ